MITGLRLIIMMFLQYTVLGAWLPVFADDMTNLAGFEPTQVGAILIMLPIAILISPMIVGPIADRWAPAQWCLAALHLAAAGVMAFASMQENYEALRWSIALWALLFVPTSPLTTAVAFHHLIDRRKSFSRVRTFGAVGWIAACVALSGLRALGLFASQTDPLLLSAIFGVATGFYSLTLPHTPPKSRDGGPMAAFDAVRLIWRRPGFGAYLGLAYVMATCGQFIMLPQGPFMTDIGVKREYLSAWLSIQQVAEVVGMGLILPLVAPRIKIHHGLAIGALAATARFLIYAGADSPTFAFFGLLMHGIAFPFFAILGQIFIDHEAPPNLRASAQSLLTLVTLGLGSLTGLALASRYWEFQKTAAGTDWSALFLAPAIATAICAAAIWFLVRAEQPDTVPELGNAD